jgi:hypothetical protein
MGGWIRQRIEKASWLGFGLWVAALFAFSYWAFNTDSPWTRALARARGKLPETQPGIPAIEPQRSMELLSAAPGDYLFWQLLDIPYAVMNLMVFATAMALGLRALRLGNSILRWLIALPIIYLCCEVVENSFVSLFALGVLPPVEPWALFQQAATTLKFGSAFAAMPFVVIGLIAALVVAVKNLMSGGK